MNTHVISKIAKLLKEKGFDVPVRNYYLLKEEGNYLHEGFEDSYWGDNRIVNWNKDVVGIKPFEGFISAPTIAEVVMWLYEKHGIWISVDIDGENFDIFYFLVYRNHEERVKEYIKKFNDENYNTNYKTPVEAYEAAIDYSLKNYI